MEIGLPSIRLPVLQIADDTRQVTAQAAVILFSCLAITAMIYSVAYPAAIVANVASVNIAVTGITPLEATAIVLIWTFGGFWSIWLFRRPIGRLISKIGDSGGIVGPARMAWHTFFNWLPHKK